MNKSVIINARKFDGVIHRSWECELIEQTGNLMVFVGVFKNEVTHPDLDVIRHGTISYEYYWLDRWYNVFRFHEPDGTFRNFYCNINKPPTYDSGILDYVDLDIDVLISRNFEIKILDIDEYRDNSRKYGYSDWLKKKVNSNVAELIRLAETGKFPFDLSDLPH